MNYDDQSVGSFLHRLLDLLEEGVKSEKQNSDRSKRRYSREASKDKDESVFVCKTEDCTFVEDSEEEMKKHIEQEHKAGAFEEVEASVVRIGSGEESFRSGSFPDLSREDRKDMVKDWFNQHCEKAQTVPGVCKEVFGKENVENGDTVYTGTWKVLNDLKEEGFLDVTKRGSWNVYFSDKSQLESLQEAV